MYVYYILGELRVQVTKATDEKNRILEDLEDTKNTLLAEMEKRNSSMMSEERLAKTEKVYCSVRFLFVVLFLSI